MATQTPDNGGAISTVMKDDTSRKNFLRLLGTGGAASALAVVIAACGDDGNDKMSSATAAATADQRGSKARDIEIVNYALTLEFIEAAFYAKAVASGAIRDKKVAELAKSIGENEQAHVEALTTAVKGLGGKPVAEPKTNFDDVFAGGVNNVLKTAAVVENLGAAAYLGQAGRINSPEILAAALSIHSVEARHAAALNQLTEAGFNGSGPLVGTLPDGAFAKPMSMEEVLKQAQPFLAS
jgi:rubrerythrin